MLDTISGPSGEVYFFLCYGFSVALFLLLVSVTFSLFLETLIWPKKAKIIPVSGHPTDPELYPPPEPHFLTSLYAKSSIL